jgi:large subunit ribosomal protein L25
VKQGGIIEQMVTEVNVECTADIIPESIEVDMSSVAMGTSVSVGDLVLPAGVVCKDDPNKVILSIMAPKKGGGEAA